MTTPDTTAPDAPPPQPTIREESRHLAKLGVPIVVSLTSATLVWVVDTIMIAPLGTVPLAAASLTGAALTIFYSALYGYVSVAGVRMAEAHGLQDSHALSVATRTAVIIAAIAGLIGTCLMLAIRPAMGFLGQPAEVVAILGGYWTCMSLLLIPFTMFYAIKSLFDAIDAPWIGVALAFVSVILNVPANYFLIYGFGDWPGLGLLGAGLASALSQTAPLILAWIVWKTAKVTRDARQPVSNSPEELRVQMKEGTTIAVGYVGEGGAYTIAALMMGWFGAAALAAHQIVSSVAGVLYMVPLGISIAVSIRISQAIGAGEAHRLSRIGLAAVVMIVSWMVVVMLAVLMAGGTITRALSTDPAVIAIATSLFVVVAVMQIADGVQGTMLGASRGIMDNKIPVAITLFFYWIIGLPVAYALAFVLDVGPNGIWMGYGFGVALAATFVTRRFFRMARS
jgi:MATE family multidrug resistance protein